MSRASCKFSIGVCSFEFAPILHFATLPPTNEADLALVSLQEPVEIGKRIGLACLPREGAALQMRDALMVQIFHPSPKVFENQCNEKLSANPGGVGSQLKQHRCAGPSPGDFNQLELGGRSAIV